MTAADVPTRTGMGPAGLRRRSPDTRQVDVDHPPGPAGYACSRHLRSTCRRELHLGARGPHGKQSQCAKNDARQNLGVGISVLQRQPGVGIEFRKARYPVCRGTQNVGPLSTAAGAEQETRVGAYERTANKGNGRENVRTTIDDFEEDLVMGQAYRIPLSPRVLTRSISV